ncbi:aldo/keto reductase family protein [Shimazuella alba]|uniref:Aldo/keto reductase n=1 Tax=Shimazuella alba TaxID=2690964 RepID=A0A6I4VTP2_9BACL|nr:aldo/keto reductase family protein [Shimazuella alba]MXQ55139.1 aldo/keto reductase [Shimazuella alba]
MKYRRVGRSGLKVSELSLGSWLTFGGYVSENDCLATIFKAFDLGVNSFDTANVYERGDAERILGKALSEFPRESVVLSTKVFWPMGNGCNDCGLSRKHIIEQCNSSLKRLGVDYIDIYYCHRFDEETPILETLIAMNDLIRQGKVLYLGVSEWTAEQIQQACVLADQYLLDRMIVNQPKYNIFNRNIESEIIPMCSELGIGQIVYSPLAQGVLAGKYMDGEEIPIKRISLPKLINEKNRRIVTGLKIIAEQEDLSLIQLVLAWTLRNKRIASAIVGASHPEQIEQSVKASGIALQRETVDRINKLLVK